MADANGNSSSTPWIAFLAGIIIVAVLAVGYFAYSNGGLQPDRTADLEVNMPDVKINPPDIDLPEPPPAPALPPAAEPATTP